MRSRAGSSAPQAVAIIPQRGTLRGRWRSGAGAGDLVPALGGAALWATPRSGRRAGFREPAPRFGAVPRFGDGAALRGHRAALGGSPPLQTEAFSFVESIPRAEALHLAARASSICRRDNCAPRKSGAGALPASRSGRAQTAPTPPTTLATQPTPARLNALAASAERNARNSRISSDGILISNRTARKARVSHRADPPMTESAW